MNTHGRTSAPTESISPERILLGRLALLSREGNSAAVAKMLADWWERDEAEDAHKRPRTGIREYRGGNWDSNPLYIPLADLPFENHQRGLRLVNILEARFGAIHVIDLEKWPHDDLIQVEQIGPSGLEMLRDALIAAGAWDKLERRRLMYRRSYHEESVHYE